MPKIEHICEICDKEFMAYASMNRRYCSKKCSKIAYKKRTATKAKRIRISSSNKIKRDYEKYRDTTSDSDYMTDDEHIDFNDI